MKDLKRQSKKSKDASGDILDLIVTGMHMYGYEKLYKSKKGVSNMKESIQALIKLGEEIGANLQGSLLEINIKFLANLDEIDDALFDISGAFLINLNSQNGSKFTSSSLLLLFYTFFCRTVDIKFDKKAISPRRSFGRTYTKCILEEHTSIGNTSASLRIPWQSL